MDYCTVLLTNCSVLLTNYRAACKLQMNAAVYTPTEWIFAPNDIEITDVILGRGAFGVEESDHSVQAPALTRQ